MSNTIGQPYKPGDHDVNFWRKCVNEGLEAEFSEDDIHSMRLTTPELRRAYANEQLDKAINERAAFAELIELCEACEVLERNGRNMAYILAAHVEH